MARGYLISQIPLRFQVLLFFQHVGCFDLVEVKCKLLLTQQTFFFLGLAAVAHAVVGRTKGKGLVEANTVEAGAVTICL